MVDVDEDDLLNFLGDTTGDDSLEFSAQEEIWLKELMEDNEEPTSLDQVRVKFDELKMVLEQRKKEFGAHFHGDRMVELMVHEMEIHLRKYCLVKFRGATEDDTFRCRLLNDRFLFKSLEMEGLVREKPQFDVQIEHDDSMLELVFMKKLFNGWCVKIDRDTFLKLAYDEDCEIPNRNNIHMLVVKGKTIRRGLGLPGLQVQFCCFNDDLHRQRIDRCYQEKLETEQRAKDMKVSLGSFDNWWSSTSSSSQNQEGGTTGLNEGIMANEFRLVLRPLSIFLWEENVYHQGDEENEFVLNLNTEHDSLQDLYERVLKNVATIGEENLNNLENTLQRALYLTAFEKKVAYWGSLRASEDTAQKILCSLFDACLGGNSKSGGHLQSVVFESARTLAETYTQEHYPGKEPKYVAQKMIQWQSSLTAQSGFITGFGGILAMPITIPTGMLATWIVSARLSFAIAHIFGHDIYHPTVCMSVLYCLVGAIDKENNDGEDILPETNKHPEEELRGRLRACLEQRFTYTEREALVVHNGSTTILTEENLDLTPIEEKENLYELLGVTKVATAKEIRTSYLRLALKYHPDKLKGTSTNREVLAKANERFQILGAAYEILSDPVKRKEYDVQLQKGVWSWKDLSWDRGLEKAKSAFEHVNKQLQQTRLQAHIVSRTATKVGAEVLEQVGARSVTQGTARGVAAMEVRSSLAAGERLAARASTTGTSRLIPLIGAVLSAAIDSATTASVGQCSIRVFSRS